MKKIYLIIFALLMCFSVSCADEKVPETPLDEIIGTQPEDLPPPENQDPDKQEDKQEEQKPVEKPQFTSELSGLAIEEKYVNTRPIAVMINNNSASLPQSGVSAADVIFECEAEGGETRMMALFKPYDKLGIIGSVRSSRDYFIDFAQIFDAVYVHAGGSPLAYHHLKDRKIQNLDGVNMYLPNCFWRDAERRKVSSLEHTLVTSGEKIAEEIDRLGYRTELKDGYTPSFKFAESEYIPDGESATYLKIQRLFSSQINYDAQLGAYTHTQHGAPHTDRENGVTLSFKNVIVLIAPHTYLEDDKNRIGVDFTGSGEGYYLTMGKYIPVTWHRDDRDGGIEITCADGELLLNPGKTFVSIVNPVYSKSITFE